MMTTDAQQISSRRRRSSSSTGEGGSPPPHQDHDHVTPDPVSVSSPSVSSVSSSIDAFDHTYREQEGPKPPRVMVWRNVFLMVLLHAGALYGLLVVPAASYKTLIWSAVCFVFSALGNDIFEWARDHRVHHKYSETDADPHNAVRGFFFAHIGWLMVRKHPDVIEKGRKLELTDLKADRVVMHYKMSVVVMCFLVPMLVPWYLWGESLWVAYFVPALLRYTLVLNATWLVNSAAHMWGNRPYDTQINPRENKFREGYHNYHHTFPYDYATSEYGCKLNLTTCFINLMCWLGLASDRKRVSREAVQARVQRTGDGSHRNG
ncbi:hypothetical protein CRUP_000959 [Coryphaenoides rupestris]|nr:hypothetical protein CRUP_000959 [Coryphaenoides rupestris]